MKLDSEKPDFAVQLRRQNLDVTNKFYSNESPQKFAASTWVKLLQLPNPFSFEEALLLCPVSQDEWLAWIPDHGEAILHTRQFCY
ncbi:MAG: hypothetical protein KME32_01890 [Mojavia pulchra JT2-VF2]|jgi:hypothetical protein|uniref:Uncharacterized protein n=1 Tax=Mojavia pulchra JT2-VF2 TaxID=287848 RepID=A0A951PTX7_9NOST|nr:hypothetical protein [Mojavia pulchra JT2-VF2]